jgi:integrase
MMRPKSTHRDLPPRMLRRTRRLKTGEVWQAFYYNGRDESGRRVEIPLGQDLNEAKRKWAELERKPVVVDETKMDHIFGRYEREIIPGKAPRTRKDNLDCLKNLRGVFGNGTIDAITPQHIALYRDKRSAKVRANREIALLSHVFNMAREWGYTAKENPCRGVRKNKEKPRDFYADDEVWSAVHAQACEELQDAMDLNYLTGQRPADVLKMRLTDIKDGALEVVQNKTKKKLRILLDADGHRTELGKLVDRVRARERKVSSLYLVATPAGKPLNQHTLRIRFDAARAAAAKAAEEAQNLELAKRVRAFQFRDIRPKAASELPLEHASKLLGHTEHEITEKVYRRVGEVVKPAK